jgi:DNA repair protein RecO (recombination protein O)
MKKSRTFKSDSIVLTSRNSQEKNRWFTCFTVDHGMISATAFGASKSSSRFCTIVQPFTVAEMLFSRSKTDLLKLDEATLTDENGTIRSSYAAILTASWFAEVIAGAHITPEDYKKYWFLLRYSLELLNDGCDPRVAFLFFCSKFLFLGGYSYVLNGCRECGVMNDIMEFSAVEGGLLCRSHMRGKTETLNKDTAGLLCRYMYDRYADLRHVIPDTSLLKILVPLLFARMKDVFERDLQSTAMLRDSYSRLD